AKPASAGRELTERARTRGAYAPVRTSTPAGRERDADSTEPDLVGARVVDDVVGLARPVRKVSEAVVSGQEGVRDGSPGRAGDDASPPHLRALIPENDRPRALEDDEELLLRSVAVRLIALGSGRDRHVAEACLDGADHVTEVEVDRTRVERPADALGEVGDAARAWRNVADLGLAHGGLTLPGTRPADVHPARMHPGDARARQHRVSLRLPLAVGEDVEPVGPGAQRVRMLLGQVDEGVAFADLEDLAVLPRETGTAENEEDLLLRSLRVRGSRPLARVDEDAFEPDGDTSGRAAEVVPVPGDVPALSPVRLDVVPVRDVVHLRLTSGLSGRGVSCLLLGEHVHDVSHELPRGPRIGHDKLLQVPCRDHLAGEGCDGSDRRRTLAATDEPELPEMVAGMEAGDLVFSDAHLGLAFGDDVEAHPAHLALPHHRRPRGETLLPGVLCEALELALVEAAQERDVLERGHRRHEAESNATERSSRIPEPEEAKGSGASVRADHRAERRDDVERRARPRPLHPADELVAVLLGLGVADSHVEVRIVLSLRRLAEDLLELTQRLRT